MPKALLVIAGLYVSSRLVPVWRHGAAAFGYDFGIYRRIVEEHFAQFWNATSPSFAFTAFSTPLYAVGLSLNDILIGWYIVFTVLLFALVYFVVKEYGNPAAALAAALLFTASVVQFEFFSWYYYRQLIALVLLLASFCLLRRRSFAAILPLVALGSLHPVSFIPAGMTLFLAGFVLPEERRLFWVTAGISLAATVILNLPEFMTYLPLVAGSAGLASAASGYRASEMTGQFVPFTDFLRMSIFILPLGLLGLYKFWKTQKFMAIFLAVNVALFASHVLLYRRFLVFIDIGFIFFASLYLSALFARINKDRIGRASAIVFSAIILVYAGMFVWSKEPIISRTELADIQTIDRTVPDGHSILVLSSREAPWVYGYARRPVIAPGLFEWNRWTEAEWNMFWSTENASVRAGLLNRYEELPLYIYVGARQASFAEMFKNDPSFQQITPFVWSYSPAL